MQACTIIIFGATGDLSKKKLLPALYHLDAENRLSKDTRVICMGRRESSQEGWLKNVTEYVSPKARGGVDDEVLNGFLEKVSYFKCDLNDASSYEELNAQLSDPANDFPSNIIFYLSISPSLFGTVGDQLAAVGLIKKMMAIVTLLLKNRLVMTKKVPLN